MTEELQYDLITVLSVLIMPDSEEIKDLILKYDILTFLMQSLKSEKQLRATLTVIIKISMYKDPKPIEII